MNPSRRLVSGWYWWRATSLSIHFIIWSWFKGNVAIRWASVVAWSSSSSSGTHSRIIPAAAASVAVSSSPVNR